MSGDDGVAFLLECRHPFVRRRGRFGAAGLAAAAIDTSHLEQVAQHWSENITSLIRKPHEPTFSAANYIAKVAQEPKRFELVDGDNHRFDGNHDGFFLKLREALEWMPQAR